MVKRQEGKSNGAQILKAEGVTSPTASELVVTFLPLWEGLMVGYLHQSNCCSYTVTS